MFPQVGSVFLRGGGGVGGRGGGGGFGPKIGFLSKRWGGGLVSNPLTHPLACGLGQGGVERGGRGRVGDFGPKVPYLLKKGGDLSHPTPQPTH